MKKIAALLAIALAGFSAYATAQTGFPSKPIQIVIGYSPGGSVDLIARMVAREAKNILGQEIIVVSKPGASGTLAVTNVATAQPDGYTLGLTPNSSLTTVQFLQDLPADLLERTTALVAVGRLQQALLVKSDSPLRTVKDLVEQARRNPGKVSVGTPGVGTNPSLIMQAIGLQEKTEFAVVQFAGEAQAMTALLGGHITAASITASTWESHVKSGTARIIAAMNEDRLDFSPNVPTLIEQGFPYASFSIYYLYGPKGLPAAVTERLVEAFGAAIRTPVYLEMATKNAMIIRKPISGEALDRFLIEDRGKTGRLVQKLGIKKN